MREKRKDYEKRVKKFVGEYTNNQLRTSDEILNLRISDYYRNKTIEMLRDIRDERFLNQVYTIVRLHEEKRKRG